MTPDTQPWKTPTVGDTLTMRDGRKRRVKTVDHWADGFMTYVTLSRRNVSRTVRCRRNTWREAASAEVSCGGSYVRGGEA